MDKPFIPRIYIGEPIQHKSEKDCLLFVYDQLKRSGRWSYIFLNFHVEGRQIDLVIFTPNTTLLIEVKGYSLPVIGEINGQWLQHGYNGSKEIGNAYNQALNAKHCLRDVIQKIITTHDYPDAAVIISPHIPSGSKLTTGDFKVKIGGLELIKELLQPIISTTQLSALECLDLAKYLSLTPVTSIDAALHPTIFESEKTYITYIDSFSTFHASNIKEHIADEYELNSQVIDITNITELMTKEGKHFIIRGPSGCGKTLLLTSSAIACIQMECIPIYITAKDFTGQFQALLDKEIGLLNMISSKNLIRAAKTLGKRIVLFVDGYNECSNGLKVQLTRSLCAFALRHNANIIISSQDIVERNDLLKLENILVRKPSNKLKITLSKINKKTENNKNILSLLHVANSGLEAVLIGKIGRLLPTGASKFIIFETYARDRLKTSITESISILSFFADYLVKQARFSLSIREFDRICHRAGLKNVSLQDLLDSLLLQRNGDSISFSHELILNTFAAESVIRSANNIKELLPILSSPKFNSAKTFIIGAIEDDSLLYEVLHHCKDQQLIAACALGECGARAQNIIRKKIDQLLKAMINEAHGVKFKITGEGVYGITIDKSSLSPTLIDFNSYLKAIGQELLAGNYYEEVMSACQNMDQAIMEFSKVSQTIAQEKKLPLRHAMFSTAYVMQRDTAIAKVMHIFRSGILSFYAIKETEFSIFFKHLWSNASTLGQYYFLLSMRRFDQPKDIAPFIVDLMQNLTSYPYHLQLELIDSAQYLHDADEHFRSQAIQVLEDSLNKHSPILNSIIFETLQILGALDHSEKEYIPTIHREIDELLTVDNDESNQIASSVFLKQFDHPYSSSYWDEIQKLDPAKKKILLIKACLGSNSSDLFFIDILIKQLSEFNDPKIASAINRWTVLPDKQHFMPQNAILVFVAAHEALGKLGVDLPPLRSKVKNIADITLLACADLIYWANRVDVINPATSEVTLQPRNILLNHSLSASAAAINIVVSPMLQSDDQSKSLLTVYPQLILEVCRNALTQQDQQATYFEDVITFDTLNIAIFCIQILGTLGDENDLFQLRNLCDHPVLGLSALEAIKKIEVKKSDSI